MRMTKTAECENCIHAKVTTGTTVIVKGGKMIIQQATPGGKNITCGAGTIREMSFTDGEMYCSSFRAKGDETGETGETGTDGDGA